MSTATTNTTSGSAASKSKTIEKVAEKSTATHSGTTDRVMIEFLANYPNALFITNRLQTFSCCSFS